MTPLINALNCLQVLDLTTDDQDRGPRLRATTSDTERDEMLYYLLAMRGPNLVFANAVSGVDRAAAILKLLGLPATALHAQQRQRQRAKRSTSSCERTGHPHHDASLHEPRRTQRSMPLCGTSCRTLRTRTFIVQGRTGRGTADGLCISWCRRERGLRRCTGRSVEASPTFPVMIGS
jgi:hypothetical protein